MMPLSERLFANAAALRLLAKQRASLPASAIEPLAADLEDHARRVLDLELVVVLRKDCQ
jgi:hypothetical protein